MTRFCLISHPLSPFFDLLPMTPFFARKLCLIAPWFDASVGAPHFYMWVPPPVVEASLNLVAHKLNIHIILLKQICGIIN